MTNTLNTFVIALAIFGEIFVDVNAEVYTDVTNLSDTLLDSTRYRKDVRPILNQSDILYVWVSFMLVSIVEVDDVSQSFKANGFLVLTWIDQILTWNTSDYGGTKAIHPHPKDIWRPRMNLLNTLDKRDIFEDDACPVTIFANGTTVWVPGGLFTTSCNMNLLKYPFDEQVCLIEMLPMSFPSYELQFMIGLSSFQYYTKNGEWDLKELSIRTNLSTVSLAQFSTLEIRFTIARRSTFFALNILFPFVLLSFLNMLVFTIPADSGEKISYGITVLLALSMFLSTVSGMLPRSSDKVPLVTAYLFILLVVSVLTVIVTIIIVFLSNQDEKTEGIIMVTPQNSGAASKISAVKKAITSLRTTLTKVSPRSPGNDSSRRQSDFGLSYNDTNNDQTVIQNLKHGEKKENDKANQEDCQERPVNRYKLIGRYIDFVSLIVFTAIWLILTLWYVILVKS